MSNPGVVTLSRKLLSDGQEFRVEDNIGEAIHFHYGDIRIDLTVSEFRSIVEIAKGTIEELVKAEGFVLGDFDPIFLDMFSDKLLEVEAVKNDVICLEDIEIIRKGAMGLPIVRKLKESHMYRALQGDVKEYEEYAQENGWKETNLERLKRILESVSEKGYPFMNNYMFFFNQQNCIRDGQHRASCLYHLYGNKEVPIKRIYFKNNKYNVSRHPWIEVLFCWDRKRINKLIRAVMRKVKHLCVRVVDKAKRTLRKNG